MLLAHLPGLVWGTIAFSVAGQSLMAAERPNFEPRWRAMEAQLILAQALPVFGENDVCHIWIRSPGVEDANNGGVSNEPIQG